MDGQDKVVHVLELGTSCSLVEMQEYARIPPGRVLLVPPPDDEAPDDLFPEEVLHPREALDSICNGNELMRLWNMARGMVRDLDIQDDQIAGWFWRYHRCRVSLRDFDGDVPSEKITVEQLRQFAILNDRANFINQIARLHVVRH